MNVRYLLLFILIFAFHYRNDALEASTSYPPQKPLQQDSSNESLIQVEALMYISPEMRAFVQKHIKPSESNDRRLRNIIDAILDPNELGFTYQFDANLTASQAFSEARGNCIAFSFMTVALLREAGLDAYFHSVKKKSTWSSFDDILMEEKHINLLVRIGFNYYEVDILPFNDRTVIDTTYLQDSQAYAKFFNNLAISAIGNRDYTQAKAYLKKALETDYTCLSAWKNLGALYRGEKNLVAARQCLLRAWSLDQKNESTYYLLAKVYRQMGDYDKSAFYSEKMNRYNESSPLYYYSRYEDELAKNELEKAEYYIIKAIKACPDMHILYYALYRIYSKQNDYSHMLEALQKAKEVSKTEKIQKAYDDMLKAYAAKTTF